MNGTRSNTYNAWYLLKMTYGIVPILAGLDKFTNYLVDWVIYLNPSVIATIQVSPTQFMQAVGVIEIIAGVMVLTKYTRLGALIVSAWLVLMALDLVSMRMFYDIAVRDLVMAVGAYALYLLSKDLGK